MKILMTGASGFVGLNLIKYLKGNDIEIIKFERYDSDETLKAKLEGVDSVVHLAGKAHDLKKTSNIDEYYDVNFKLTKKLYDAYLSSTAKRFIFISSVKAAADSIDAILEESIIPNPETHYGKSKLLAERYIQELGVFENKSYIILRPCMIHGPGNKGNLNLLYKFVEKNVPYPLAAFQNQRSYLSVGNLCFVIERLILKDQILSGLYHVADDKSLSTNEVISIITNRLNKSIKLLWIPKKLVKIVARIGDLLGLPLNTERLCKLTENYIVSNKMIKNELAIELPLSSEAGMIITVDSFILNDK
ncbi:NAD-dependent epimerase/dehydratase family protein [Pedobacter sp. MR2016-24]|uniref:NAD-dependent epimerase/dehydratase family protein n=1 Tax=Pedobacter sp. MR2016-24 TaxID=2994466 RepID=UPI0022487496|nr:NAD-dependent epimerase/dehydratase family protein [Pedobacter sp. MR2016-24]MCX2485264.1 NAD-dependent epimerase/dehydratase family protein [Pedobacter sp. MR2016-24]